MRWKTCWVHQITKIHEKTINARKHTFIIDGANSVMFRFARLKPLKYEMLSSQTARANVGDIRSTRRDGITLSYLRSNNIIRD